MGKNKIEGADAPNKETARFYFKILRATACKYGESDERSENSRFLLLPQKDSWRAIFRNTLTVPESSHFCEIKESSTEIPLNQQQR